METCVSQTNPNLTSSEHHILSLLEKNKKDGSQVLPETSASFLEHINAEPLWWHDREVYLFLSSNAAPVGSEACLPLPHLKNYYSSVSIPSLPFSRAHSPEQKNILSQFLSQQKIPWDIMMMRQKEKKVVKTHSHRHVTKTQFGFKINYFTRKTWLFSCVYTADYCPVG